MGQGKMQTQREKYLSPDRSARVFVGNSLHTLAFAGLLLPIKLLVRITSFKEVNMEK